MDDNLFIISMVIIFHYNLLEEIVTFIFSSQNSKNKKKILDKA